MDQSQNKKKIFPCIWQAIILLSVSFAAMIAISIAVNVGSLIVKIFDIEILNQMTVYADFAVNLILLPIALGVILATKQPLTEIFSWKSTKLIYFMPIVVLILGSSIVESEMDNFIRYIIPMPGFIQKIMMNLVQEKLPSFILLVIVASLTEELLFRGVILRGFLTHYGKVKSIIISALFFSLFHLNIYQFFSAFVLGLILGWIYTETRSLYACFFVHSFHNLLCWLCAFNILNIYIPGYTFEGEMDYNHVEFQPLWFNLLGIVLLVIGIYLLHRVFKITANQSTDSTGQNNEKIKEGSVEDQAVNNI